MYELWASYLFADDLIAQSRPLGYSARDLASVRQFYAECLGLRERRIEGADLVFSRGVNAIRLTADDIPVRSEETFLVLRMQPFLKRVRAWNEACVVSLNARTATVLDPSGNQLRIVAFLD